MSLLLPKHCIRTYVTLHIFPCSAQRSLVTGTMSKAAPDFSFEQAAHARGLSFVAGVDEVGRGPLAGPVVAAAVILDPANIPDGLNDSKKLKAWHKNRTTS